MTCTAPAPARPAPPTPWITVFGCIPAEAALFEAMTARLGVQLTVTDAELSADNLELAVGNRCVSVGHRTPITADLLGALHDVGVRHLCTRSIGVDHIDVVAAERLGVSVDNVAYSPDSVADFTLMQVLMLLRGAPAILRSTDAHDYRLQEAPGRELRDLTVGVVGTGRIGSAVVRRLRAFGCRILANDQRPHASADYVSLGELLQKSDVVTLHTPLDPKTHHLLDRHRIAQMRPGALLVNTARGELVDTEALVEALEDGRLGGAALDVVEGEAGVFSTDCRGEPIDRPWLLRLQRSPNVIISPHTAYFTDRALSDAVEASILSCIRFEGRHQHA